MCENFVTVKDPKRIERMFDYLSQFNISYHLELFTLGNDVIFKFCFMSREDFNRVDQVFFQPMQFEETT